MNRFLLTISILLVIYSRFVGINWGLPYPMHPDERNMANAVQSLNCKFSIFNFQFSSQPLSDCLNPHFFAYGQLPIYTGYALIETSRFLRLQPLSSPITFDEATLSLRLISALASLLTVWVLYKIIFDFFINKKNINIILKITTLLILSFPPYAVQLAHFGTTESILIMLYSLIIFLSLKLSEKLNTKNIALIGIITGVSVGVKTSSLIFAGVPIVVLIFWFVTLFKKNKRKGLLYLVNAAFLTTLLFVIGYVISSPYNIIAFKDFLGSMNYESAVALGKVDVFYTRQFFETLPYYFQFIKIFPFALGLPMLIIFVTSYLLLPFKNFKIWVLRLSFLIPFVVLGATYAKWSRFISLVFPVMSIIVSLGILRIYEVVENRKIASLIITLLVIISIIPGLAYMSIYQNSDVRFKASEWIYKNIESGETILSETANVVDIPLALPERLRITGYKLQERHFNVISFDFYNVDTDIRLEKELTNHLQNINYMFVPSRRIFANHTCLGPSTSDQALNTISYKFDRCEKLEEKYPILSSYYKNLFDRNKYQKIAEFTSYPKISLFGKTFLEFPDENSEETWTVFDHPVIRIYKKVKY